MMKKLIILLPFLLIQLVSFSQTGISNGTIIRTDSIVYYVFDSVTVDTVVKDLIRYDECKETQDSLFSLIQSEESLIKLQKKTISEQSIENQLLSESLKEKQNLLVLKNEENRDCQKEKNKLDTKRRLSAIGAYLLGGTTLIEGIIITTLIIKQ